MSTYQWASPYPNQKWGPKQFGVSWRNPDLIAVLEMVARCLSEINGGQLWKHNGRPHGRPEVHPSALELSARCTYPEPGARTGVIDLDVVVQPHAHLPQTGVVLTFANAALGPPWLHHDAESIVAQTVMQVGESLYYQSTGSVLGTHPCEMWSILIGSWAQRATIRYGVHWVELI